jgi:hypothetical protein
MGAANGKADDRAREEALRDILEMRRLARLKSVGRQRTVHRSR